jgi:hypothetical protein
MLTLRYLSFGKGLASRARVQCVDVSALRAADGPLWRVVPPFLHFRGEVPSAAGLPAATCRDVVVLSRSAAKPALAQTLLMLCRYCRVPCCRSRLVSSLPEAERSQADGSGTARLLLVQDAADAAGAAHSNLAALKAARNRPNPASLCLRLALSGHTLALAPSSSFKKSRRLILICCLNHQ